ncbi:MAG: N-formylglutamate deformylase [Alphaproteobacteria bacterium]|nr:N-formylglutamate deformylase [Alphaproteobacteria bacterium]
MELYHYYPGTTPVIVNIPHAGTHVPPQLKARFTPEAQSLPDTDWHVERLYAFVRDTGAHLLVAQNSRYMVDLNRNKAAETLYPGQFNTEVVPLHTFDGKPIYLKGEEPDAREVQERIAAYWQPYHNKLQKVLAGTIEKYGRAVLLDAHSIRSEVPQLFEGVLPSLSIGTSGGETAAADLTEKVLGVCEASPYSTVLNGRFKGGYITRNYGKPDIGSHVIQLEMAQKDYMHEGEPFEYAPAKAAQMQRLVLKPLVEKLIHWAMH